VAEPQPFSPDREPCRAERAMPSFTTGYKLDIQPQCSRNSNRMVVRESSMKTPRECSVPLFSATLGLPTSRGKRSADSVARSNAKGRDGSASDCRECKEERSALYFPYAPTCDDEADAAISRAIRHAEDALPFSQSLAQIAAATSPHLYRIVPIEHTSDMAFPLLTSSTLES
jgi:hypothetical protein